MSPPISGPPRETLELVRRGSMRRNIVWSVAGTAIYGGCQLGYVITAARLGDAAVVGRFALAFAVTTPIILLANCALRTIQASDAREEFRFGDYLTFRLLALAGAGVAIAATAMTYDDITRRTILWIGAAKVCESLSDLFQGDFQRRERLDLIGISNVSRGLLSLAAWSVALVYAQDVTLAAAALAATWAVVLIGFDLPVFAAFHAGGLQEVLQPRWNTERQRRLFSLTAPMGVTVMSGALIANLPRYFLESLRGPAELGIFAALAGVAAVGNLLATAVAHAALPRLAQSYANSEPQAFRKLGRSLLIVGGGAGLAIAILGAVSGGPILNCMFGAEYADHAGAFRLLLFSIAISIQVCFLDHVFYAARWFRIQVPINVATLIGLGLLCPPLIASGGIVGAAWATCIAAAAQGLVRFVIARSLLWQRSNAKEE